MESLESAPKHDGGSEAMEDGQCHECNAYTYEEDNFCACCGAALTGHPPQRHPIAIFCAQCGTPIDQRTGKE
jgi:predicted amidophosphoribosyltransferase